jgi:hypothetical protein
MKYQNTITDTFSTAYKSASQPNSYLKISAYPNNYSQTIFNEHRLTLRINDNLLDTIRTNDYHRIDTTIAFSGAFLNSTGVNNFTLRYSPLSSFSTGQIYFDYLEFRYPRRFEFESNYLSFTTELSDTSSRLFRVKGFNAGNEIKIYDIKNGYRITNYTVSGDTLFFSGKGNGNFEIANISITKKPFRIKQKQVPDLVSIQNGADHIIVYNKLFQSQAEQLRAYRSSHDTMRAVKAEIEDIYDIFNYGMEDPTAVKNFLKYAYFNWQAPKVRYVLLFGRGSLDPKKSSSSSNYYQNLVPVYGNPSSDGYFVNFTPDNLTYFYQISTGRLPAYSMQEAQDMVNKIISYDGQQPEKWFKEYIFIAGGLDSNQQIQNSIKSEILIANYVLPPPISGHPVRIYRRGGGYVTYNYSDSIRNSINRGSLIVNYIGHAASSTWDTGLEDPSVLNNDTKLPLVLSMTCFTGKNAETSDRTFSEKFMYLPEKVRLDSSVRRDGVFPKREIIITP